MSGRACSSGGQPWTTGEKEGTWQEKMPSSAGEERGTALHLHTHSTTPHYTTPL